VFMTVLAQHGRKNLSESEIRVCDENRSAPAVRDYRVDFILGDKLSPAPSSAHAASLFRSR
jgi:hypothetical protein